MHAQGWNVSAGGRGGRPGRGWRRALVGLVAIGLLGGCEDREVSLQIVQMEIDGQCLLQATSSGGATNALGEGAVDLAITTNYAVFPRVTNNMLDVTEVNTFVARDGRIDTHDVVLKEAVIRYESDEGLPANLGDRRRVPLSGTIPVNASAVVGMTVLTPAMIEELRASPRFLVTDSTDGSVFPVRTSVQVLMRIVLKGETLDGTDVTSNEFVFPVRVCNGCRVLYPPDAIDESAPVQPNCLRLPDPEADTAIIERQACQLPGTDNNFVDCRECPGR